MKIKIKNSQKQVRLNIQVSETNKESNFIELQGNPFWKEEKMASKEYKSESIKTINEVEEIIRKSKRVARREREK